MWDGRAGSTEGDEEWVSNGREVGTGSIVKVAHYITC